MASLAEVAARYPSDIQNMFTYDGQAIENGSVVGIYTVRFFNSAGAARYVTVDTELPGGGSYYDHPENGVLWPALAEKAYAVANGDGFVSTSYVGSDSYGAMNNGYASWAYKPSRGIRPAFTASTPVTSHPHGMQGSSSCSPHPRPRAP